MLAAAAREGVSMDGDQVAPCARRDLSLAQLATTSNLAHGVLQQVQYTAASQPH
jgi:hypothetical protein